MPYNCFGYPMMSYWGTGGWAGLIMIVWWLIVITAVILAVRWLAGQSAGSAGRGKGPMDILRERYAKGEINKDEFEKMKKDLS